MKLLTAFFVVGIFGRLIANSHARAFPFIDEHLDRWDRFARGTSELAPVIRKNRDEFHKQLLSLLRADAKQGVPRLVYYMVIQVVEIFPLESEFGKEVIRLFPAVPVDVDEKKNGEKSIFGGHLYLWWREHKSDYAAFPPLEEWEKRELSRKFIKMYESAHTKAKKG